MTIYIDAEHKCHVSNDGTMREFNVPFFEGKCKTFVEGYKYFPESGSIYTPWRDFALLEEFQTQYEAQLAEAAAAYESGVNSI